MYMHMHMPCCIHALHARDAPLGRHLLRVGEQVADRLVVELEHRDEALVLVVAQRHPLAHALEEARHRARCEAGVVVGALHRVRLAGAGLAVGEDAHVEAVEHRGHEHLRRLEDLLLRRARPEGVREVELLELLEPAARGRVPHRHELPARHLDHLLRIRRALGPRERPHAAADAQVADHVLDLVVQRAPLRILGDPLLLGVVRARALRLRLLPARLQRPLGRLELAVQVLGVGAQLGEIALPLAVALDQIAQPLLLLALLLRGLGDPLLFHRLRPRLLRLQGLLRLAQRVRQTLGLCALGPELVLHAAQLRCVRRLELLPLPLALAQRLLRLARGRLRLARGLLLLGQEHLVRLVRLLHLLQLLRRRCCRSRSG